MPAENTNFDTDSRDLIINLEGSNKENIIGWFHEDQMYGILCDLNLLENNNDCWQKFNENIVNNAFYRYDPEVSPYVGADPSKVISFPRYTYKLIRVTIVDGNEVFSEQSLNAGRVFIADIEKKFEAKLRVKVNFSIGPIQDPAVFPFKAIEYTFKNLSSLETILLTGGAGKFNKLLQQLDETQLKQLLLAPSAIKVSAGDGVEQTITIATLIDAFDNLSKSRCPATFPWLFGRNYNDVGVEIPYILAKQRCNIELSDHEKKRIAPGIVYNVFHPLQNAASYLPGYSRYMSSTQISVEPQKSQDKDVEAPKLTGI